MFFVFLALSNFLLRSFALQGIFEYENGQRYMGEWKNDRFHGSGTYTLNDGAT
jgi:hypothetical protein